MTTYRVTNPMVLLKVQGAGGKSVVTGFYAGAILPSSVAAADADNLARHLDRGWIEELNDAEAVPVPAPAPRGPDDQIPDPGKVPSGTADEVLAWVDNDRDRAALALATEEASAKPRTTLVGQLTKLANPA